MVSRRSSTCAFRVQSVTFAFVVPGVASARAFRRSAIKPAPAGLLPSDVTPSGRPSTRSSSSSFQPLRWMGIRFAQEGFARLDKKAAATGQAPTGTTLVERIGRH